MGGGLTPALRGAPPWAGRAGNPAPRGKRSELGHAAAPPWLPEGQHIPAVTSPTASTANRRQGQRVALWQSRQQMTQPGSKAGPFSEKGGANEQRRLSFSGDRREDDPTAPGLGTTVRLGGAVTEHAGVSARLARGCPSLGLSLTHLHPSHGTTEMKTSTAKAAGTTEAGETCEAQSARQEPSR